MGGRTLRCERARMEYRGAATSIQVVVTSGSMYQQLHDQHHGSTHPEPLNVFSSSSVTACGFCDADAGCLL